MRVIVTCDNPRCKELMAMLDQPPYSWVSNGEIDPSVNYYSAEDVECEYCKQEDVLIDYEYF